MAYSFILTVLSSWAVSQAVPQTHAAADHVWQRTKSSANFIFRWMACTYPFHLTRYLLFPISHFAPHSLKTSATMTDRYKNRHMARISTEKKRNLLESNINKNNVNAEALEMWSADSAQPCLITVHLGQRTNGRLGCRPRQTMFHLASTARKSWVWVMRVCWCRRSTKCKDKRRRQATTREFSLMAYLHGSESKWWNYELKCQGRSVYRENDENALLKWNGQCLVFIFK